MCEPSPDLLGPPHAAYLLPPLYQKQERSPETLDRLQKRLLSGQSETAYPLLLLLILQNIHRSRTSRKGPDISTLSVAAREGNLVSSIKL